MPLQAQVRTEVIIHRRAEHNLIAGIQKSQMKQTASIKRQGYLHIHKGIQDHFGIVGRARTGVTTQFILHCFEEHNLIAGIQKSQIKQTTSLKRQGYLHIHKGIQDHFAIVGRARARVRTEVILHRRAEHNSIAACNACLLGCKASLSDTLPFVACAQLLLFCKIIIVHGMG